jgi:Leucine-rich repeat (LRR) protein
MLLAIQHFTKLTNLDLEDTGIQDVFPMEICCLVNLEYLNLSKNRILSLSMELDNLITIPAGARETSGPRRCFPAWPCSAAAWPPVHAILADAELALLLHAGSVGRDLARLLHLSLRTATAIWHARDGTMSVGV